MSSKRSANSNSLAKHGRLWNNCISLVGSIATIRRSLQGIQFVFYSVHKLKETAISELDKYIDQAIIAKLGRVRIIHGKHGGVLREAVHEYLSSHPYVKEYNIADYTEGGLGVTVAILGKNNKLK